MVKNLLRFLIIFLMLTSISFARTNRDEIRLQDEYGKDLTHVPFFLRFDYQNKYNKDWKETFYNDRKSFLLEYEREAAIERAKDKAEAKAEAAKERERSLEKKAEFKKIRDRQKAELAEERAEEKEDSDRQKSFNATIHQQQTELQQMQQEFQQEKH